MADDKPKKGETMGAELLAGLRGIIGSPANYIGESLLLLFLALAIYFIYRMIS